MFRSTFTINSNTGNLSYKQNLINTFTYSSHSTWLSQQTPCYHQGSQRVTIRPSIHSLLMCVDPSMEGDKSGGRRWWPRARLDSPSAMAPSTRMPDSLMTQSGWKSKPLSRGSRCGSSSSRNTLANTSNAAAEHFPARTEDINKWRHWQKKGPI